MSKQFYDGYNECYNNKCDCALDNNKISSLLNIDWLFNNFNIDDIILLAIILVLLHDGTDDIFLLIIIGVLFLVGIT